MSGGASLALLLFCAAAQVEVLGPVHAEPLGLDSLSAPPDSVPADATRADGMAAVDDSLPSGGHPLWAGSLFGSRRSGVWGFRRSFWPGEDGMLSRTVGRWRARDVVRANAFLAPVQQARTDSFGLRPLAPDVPNVDPPEKLSLQITPVLDPDRTRVEVARVRRDDVVGPRIRLALDEYLEALSRQTFHSEWEVQRRKGIQLGAAAQQRDGLVSLRVPIELPSQLQGIFGKGEPRLNVRGSERITFSGTSKWRPNEKVTEFGRAQSKFPQLDMVQELNLQLTGTIGDKVSVDVDQSSQTTTPLANRIKIRYKGYEDEILQSVDLGNTNLVLPGTQYVTFNSRVEGLFGISALARLADVDLNLILSKQEGRSDSKSVTRSAETRTVRIDDLDYVQARFFFLRDPDLAPWDVVEDSLEVFVADRRADNDTQDNALDAVATLDGSLPADGDPAQFRDNKFRRLSPGEDKDYQIRRGFYWGQPVLELTRALAEDEVLAVTYRGRFLDPQGQETTGFGVGEIVDSPSPINPLRLKLVRHIGEFLGNDLTVGPFAPIRNLELKNVYDLGARDILPEGFTLRIRLKKTIGSNQEPDAIGEDTFLEITGLDLQRRTSTDFAPGPDQLVDEEFINYTAGILFFPDLRPFDPDSSDLCLDPQEWQDGLGYCRFNPGGPGDDRRQSRPSPIPADLRAPAVYDRRTHPNPENDSRYYLELVYRSPVSNIQLNAFNILPGSDVVTAGGRTLQRDRDYRIDYDLGEIELLDAANVTESEDVRVTYSYLPFGGGNQKTLAGAAASYKPQDSKWRVSSAWLFEGKSGVPGLQGRRPRLGEEPSRTLVGEFASSYRTESWLMTRLANALPGVDARLPSRLEIDAGMGISLPNPNTEDKLYIDDFDGAKDVFTLSLARRSWKPASMPASIASAVSGGPEQAALLRGESWWYTPRSSVKEGDIQPTLDPQEGDDNRTVLEIKYFPAGESWADRMRSWGGLVQPLSRNGLDLTRAQFLDVWVNDFVRYDKHLDRGGRRGTLVVDLGRVSEDAIWKRQDPASLRLPPDQRRVEPPNGRLDTEDTDPVDGQLDQNSQLDEDTGLDRILSGREGDDPLDDYDFDDDDPESDPRKYAFVNGFEGNQDLDTEDLNGTGSLDTLNSHFEIRIDLADSALWETDVYRDYVVRDPGRDLEFPIGEDNGWRRIRIPLQADSLIRQVSGGGIAPAWDRIFHARVWLTGFEDSARVQIGGVEITGNRWQEGPLADQRDRALPDSLLAPGEDFFVSVLNNKDDSGYIPPFSPGEQNGITEREQSITLELRNIQPDHRGSIYRSYPTPQDYTLYENMEFFLNSRADVGPAPLALSIRLCKDANSDTTNYYEYRTPVPTDWRLVRVDFAELSRLQLLTADSTSGLIEVVQENGDVLRRKGRPSLTSVQRIAFIIENAGETAHGSGNVWIDELRLTQVKRDTGVATRVSVSGNFSDLLSFNTSLVRTNADFLKIGADRGSGVTSTSLGANTNVNLDRFFPRARLAAPLRLSLTRARSVPKFQTNSDLVVDRASDRDITERDDRDISLSLRKESTDNPWIRYVVAPFGVSGGYRRSANLQPTARDTTITKTGSLTWSSPREDLGRIRLGSAEGRGLQLQFLPTSLGFALSGSRSERRSYSRTDLSQPYRRNQTASGNSAGLSLTAGLRPISLVSWNGSSSRDLLLRRNQMSVAGANLGRETGRRQSVTSSYDVPLLRASFAPRVSYSSGSDLNFLRTGGSLPTEPDRYNDYGNNRSITLGSRVDVAGFLRSLRRTRGGTGDRSAGMTSRQTSDPDDPDLPGEPVDERDEPPRTEPDARPTVQRPGPKRRLPITLGVINVNYSLSRSHGLSRVRGEPTVLYQLGVSEDFGDGVRRLSRSIVTRNHGKTLSLDTTFQWQSRLTMNVRYNRNASETASGSGRTDETRTRWPEVDVTWGDAARAIVNRLGLEKQVRSIQASTRYSRETSERGRGGDATPRVKDGSSEANRYTPLVNLTVTLASGLSTSFTSSSSTTRTKSFAAGTEKQDLLEDRQFGLTCKKRLSLVRTVKVPLSNSQRTVTTQVDLNGGVDWRENRSESRQRGQIATIGRDTVNLKFTAGAGYQFTNNINGNASINFGQNTDRKNQSLTERFIGLSVSAAFTF